MKFRKKPVIIEATQFNGFPSPDFLPENLVRLFGIRDNNPNYPVTSNENGKLIIHTLEGDMIAEIHDWIIKGVKGEFYPCKPDIFEQTYERMEE